MRPKNGFFTFCFALVPGAGEMYLGMMRKGLTIMCGFWGLISICGFFQIDFLLFFLPVIWCYSFFDTMNSRSLSPQELKAIDEAYWAQGMQSMLGECGQLFKKRHLLVGWGLILIGVWSLMDTAIWAIGQYLPEWVFWAARRIPNVIVYIVIIGFGIHLVRGKRPQKSEHDFVAYKGEDHHE